MRRDFQAVKPAFVFNIYFNPSDTLLRSKTLANYSTSQTLLTNSCIYNV